MIRGGGETSNCSNEAVYYNYLTVAVLFFLSVNKYKTSSFHEWGGFELKSLLD